MQIGTKYNDGDPDHEASKYLDALEFVPAWAPWYISTLAPKLKVRCLDPSGEGSGSMQTDNILHDLRSSMRQNFPGFRHMGYRHENSLW